MTLCSKLTAFADQELRGAEADQFRAHLAGCGPCYERLQAIWALDSAAVRVLQREPSPARLAAVVVVGAALAVGLLLTSCARGSSTPRATCAPVAAVGDGFSRGRP